MAGYVAPNIVTNTLVVCLDAANPLSYTSGSTTWYDLSGNKNNFTLYNGVGFSTENGGCLTFDGVNDYVASTNTLNLSTYSYAVIEIFFKSTTTSTVMLFEQTNNWNSNPGGFGLVLNDTGGGNLANCNHTNHNTEFAKNYLVTSNSVWSNNLNIYGRVSDSTGRLTYVNGILTPFTATGGGTNTDTGAGQLANSTFYIGSRGGASLFFKGNISSLKIYGFKISATEVSQNYNTLKTRFGL